MINGENCYPRAKNAIYFTVCAAPDEQYKSLCSIECVLGECNDCPAYNILLEEIEITDNDNHIPFHWYDDILPSYLFYCVLPIQMWHSTMVSIYTINKTLYYY